MIAKTFEVRDRSTFIPMLAVKLNPACEADRYLLARAGFGTTPERQREYIFLCRIDGGGGKGTCDPQDWGGNPRTVPMAHGYLLAHFDDLESGAVIDVEFILKETPKAKKSERTTDPLPE